MHDFDFDAMQKKRIARGAAHMKRGSKSKRCALPSDHMTHAEWKRRNGPVSTYNLNAPMNYNEFKDMPEDIQEQYLRRLRSVYRATDAMIAGMFFVDPTTVYLSRRRLGLNDKMPRMYGEEQEARDAKWNAFITGSNENEEELVTTEKCVSEHESVSEKCSEEDPEMKQILESHKAYAEAVHPNQKPIDLPSIEVEVEEAMLNLDELTAVFSGKFDSTKFLRWLVSLPMPEGNVRIKVEVTRE